LPTARSGRAAQAASCCGRRNRRHRGLHAVSVFGAIVRSWKTAGASVDLELTVGLSGILYQRFDAGDLDVIFVERRAGDARGQTAWRERLVWIGRPGIRPDPQLALPLILYPPSVPRALALDALERARRPWRIACTTGSLSGLYAAARAGLGVAPHSGRLIPSGLAALPSSPHLPDLAEIEFVVIGPGPHDKAASALVDTILSRADRLQQGSNSESAPKSAAPV
jgi:DNA-binding transcriptional LysR family regulator